MISKLKMTIVFSVLFLGINASFSNEENTKNQEAEKTDFKKWDDYLKKQMENQKEILKKYKETKSFQKFQDLFEQMQKDFDKDFQKNLHKDLKNFFDPSFFQQFLQHSGIHSQLEIGEHKWLETASEKVLVLKIEIDKKSPLDIDISNGKIVVKGKVTKKETLEGADGSKSVSESVRSFSQSFILPKDVDPLKAQIKQDGPNISIHFPKKNIKNRVPIKKNKGDETI